MARIMAEDTGGGTDFKKVPAGCHFAICNMVVDMGWQETTFKQQAKQQHKVYIRWEVPDERVTYEKDGQQIQGPCNIGATYTLSLSEKANLRKLLEIWRGVPFTSQELRGFDITTIAGKCCQIMVQHKTVGDKTYANIIGVMGLSKDQKERGRKAQSEVGVLVYSLDEPDPHVYQQLPNWLKDKLETRIPAPGLHTANAQTPTGDDFEDDDIPF